MAEKRKLIIEYSKQSLINAKEIVAYLRSKFTEKEVNNFYKALNEFEKIISVYPTLYSESRKRKIRRAVLSKVLSVFYSINKNKISIVAIFDNRWDETSKLK
jgi:N-acetyl-gamma-glutamylphosphate reductase